MKIKEFENYMEHTINMYEHLKELEERNLDAFKKDNMEKNIINVKVRYSRNIKLCDNFIYTLKCIYNIKIDNAKDEGTIDNLYSYINDCIKHHTQLKEIQVYCLNNTQEKDSNIERFFNQSISLYQTCINTLKEIYYKNIE